VAPEGLERASREELIDLVVDAHELVDRERTRREQLERQLQWFKKQLFGAKSERRIDLVPDPSQLSLGESLTREAAAEEQKTVVPAHVRRKAVTRTEAGDSAGLRFDDSVPVTRIVVPNPELDGLADHDLVQIDERITHQLAQQPASYRVIEYVRHVVKRRDTGEICCPPAPSSVLEKSYADVSLLAGMLVDKFRYHLPLYRQHQRMQAAGITVSRASLSNWVQRTSELLEPIYQAQLASVLESQVLAMDETPIRAGRKAKGKMRTAYFWPIYGDRHEVVFPYASSRAHAHVEALLGEFAGTLLSDGYGAYPAYAERRAKVEHALCWAHTRRGFVQAEDVEPDRVARALEFIGRLYAIETEIRAKRYEGEARQKIRGDESRQIVAEFFEWLKRELGHGALLPRNPFTAAARYALERRRGLEVFLGNPDVPIDTNHLERTLRPIPMGRKSWLFCWTELGAERVGQVQSLIATCVLQGVDPYTYLVDVLQRIAVHPRSRVPELTPRLWKEHFAADPMRSVLNDAAG
jgi:transposase